MTNQVPDAERIKAAFFAVAQWEPSADDIDHVRDLLVCKHCYARSGVHRRVAGVIEIDGLRRLLGGVTL